MCVLVCAQEGWLHKYCALSPKAHGEIGARRAEAEAVELAREDLGQGSNFESFLPVRSRLAPAHRWLVAIGQERVQERLCKGPSSVEHWVGAHESCWPAVPSASIVTTDLNLMNLHQPHFITPLCEWPMARRGKPGAWAGVYSPNGERLAFVGEDGRVRVVDAKST